MWVVDVVVMVVCLVCWFGFDFGLVGVDVGVCVLVRFGVDFPQPSHLTNTGPGRSKFCSPLPPSVVCFGFVFLLINLSCT